MPLLSIMPITCDRNEIRYSMTDCRLAFQTAIKNLSSFISLRPYPPFTVR